MPVCWLGIRRICRGRPSSSDDALDIYKAQVAAPRTEGDAVARKTSPQEQGPHLLQLGRKAVAEEKDAPKDAAPKAAPMIATKGVDYEKFRRLVEAEENAEKVPDLLVVGRAGWNAATINGVYVDDGSLNGRPRLQKRGEQRWLKFNDAGQWMISKYSDGRPLGEAFACDAPERPSALHGPWYVCNDRQGWEPDHKVAVLSGACACCGSALLRPLRCSRCRAVGYCSAKCQKADWRFHRRICGQPEVGSPAEDGASLACPREDPSSMANASGEEDSDDEALLRSLHRNRAACTGVAVPAPPEALRRVDDAPEPAPDPGRLAVSHSRSPSCWNAAGTWEEKNMMPWVARRLHEILLASPPLKVSCGSCGGVEVVGVEHIEGFASLGLNRGSHRHIFDLSFEVAIRAEWLGDHGTFSTKGAVEVVDFSSASALDPDAACGMTLDLMDAAGNPREEQRRTIAAALPPTRRDEIALAVGASHHEVLAGRGLMSLVHKRLRAFAEEFMRQ